MQVQKLRLQRGWSQQQLADLSGLSVRTIQRLESGQAASTETLKSLASVFEIDFTQFSADLSMTPTSSNPSHQVELEEQLAMRQVRRVRGFYLHLCQFVLVIGLLAAINLYTAPHRLWFFWPALGWGAGLLIHALRVFEWLPFLGADWERRQVEKRLGRPL